MSNDTPAEGVLGLEPVYEGKDPVVDIVFVHGLGANPAYAWRREIKENGRPTGVIVNWLKDEGLLPTALPNARILAYNYESKWHKDAAKTRIYTIGDHLMRAIHSDRELKQDAKQRPIIFVGHSFGGIVIEQGLVNASHTSSPFKDVAQCTGGCVFLGTPHQGSNTAALGVSLANISKVFGFEGDATLMEALRSGSDKLLDIVHQFMMFVNHNSIDIVNFFEQKKTRYGAKWGAGFNEMVVTEQSGCIPGYPKSALPCDHLKMSKPEGPHDPVYMQIKEAIMLMVQKAPEKVALRFNPRTFVQDNSLIPAVNLECQKALFISWPDAELKGIKRRLGDRTPDTCTWLLKKEDYNSWLREQRPQLLRLVGFPGMGKSMIITFLIEQLTETLTLTPDMALAFHFCDNRNQSSNNATAVVRQILFQLFQQRPKHFHILQKAYDIQGGKLFHDFYTMWRILLEVITVYGDGELFILIDALDECDETSRGLLMHGMAEITEKHLNVRVFFTCRPEADIERHHRGNDRTLSLNIKGSDIDADIQKYMADKVPKLCKKQGWGPEEETLITDTLMAKANGIFLWCAFVLQDIEKVQMKYAIQECLDELPKDLQGVYERITKDFVENTRPTAKMVLEIVTGARRPLKVDELTMTYLLADESPRCWLQDILPPNSETSKLDDVYLCCGRLLRLDEPTNTVNLVHQSAKDYLLASYLIAPGLINDRKHFPENTRETNIRMNNLFLEIIFRYFGLKTFEHLRYRMVFDAEWDIDWECSWWEMDPSPSFMVYCGREWELHAQDAEGHAKIGKTVGMERWNKHIIPPTRNSWLRRAATKGNKPFVEWLLKHGAKLESADFRGWNSLQLAAKNGKKEVITFLVQEMEADIDSEASHIDGRTPIQTAAEEGLNDVIKLLLQLNANINSPPAKIHGRTALQAAAEKAQIDTIKLLLEQDDLDCDFAGAEVSGVTALLAGAGSGGEWQMGKNIHRTIKQRSRLPGSAEIDTQKIADEDQQDREQRRKEEKDHEDVVKLLVEGGSTLIPNQFNWTALHAAVERESDTMVEEILSIPGVNHNVIGYHDGTPLHSAKAKANEELAKTFEAKDGTSDPCTYSKLDLDAMMKYIRAVLTRLMIKSNTERFFFIQSYIPIYHVIYSYCAEGADDQNDIPQVEPGGRRGELVYRDVDAWLKSYVMWNQKFIFDTPLENDFLTVYLREWKLFKRGAYYVGRMLRYLTRHWVKHQRDELKHKDVREIADLFFHRWRAGMTSKFRSRLKKLMRAVDDGVKNMKHKDTRVLDAINESLDGPFDDFKDTFARAKDYFSKGFRRLKYDNDNSMSEFEVILRELTDEFEVETEVWMEQKPNEDREKIQHENKRAQLLKLNGRGGINEVWSDAAADFYLNHLEPHFLAPYSGGRTAEIKKDLATLWDMLRDNPDEAQQLAASRVQNLNAAADNADIEVNGHADGEDAHMTNGIPQTPLKEATPATA